MFIVGLLLFFCGCVVGACVRDLVVSKFWNKQVILADAYDNTAKALLKRARFSAQCGNLHSTRDEFALAEEYQARAREIRKVVSGNEQG